MIPLHFNLRLVQFLADHRNVYLTKLFLAASLFGTAGIYFALIMLVYVVWDKRLAIRLSVLILLTMWFNDLLKIFFRNPRPFVADGTYWKKWAVSPTDAKALAAEYSTPSGHAMGSSAFYSYLFAFSRNRFARAAIVLVILLIGVSRPYLGVHYVEDVLLGWAFGLSASIIAIRYTNQIARVWRKFSFGWQIVLAVAASCAFWLIAVALNGRQIDNQVRSTTAYYGLFTGIVIAWPLEQKIIGFDPRSSSAPAKILRFAISIALMAVVLFALKNAFRSVAETTALGCALEYLRYVAAEVAGMFLAPLLFCKMGLAQTVRPATE